MPPEFWIIVAVCVGIMLVSAWFLGEEDRRIRNLSRMGLVLGGTGIFVATIYHAAILAAALVVLLPVALAVAWWNGLWS
jgi:hypothetical protein